MDFVKFVEPTNAATGQEAKNIYEEIISTTPSSSSSTSNQTASTIADKHLRRPRKPLKSKRKSQNPIESIPFTATAFYSAATSDNVTTLAAMNYIGNDINQLDQYGWSALMMAACEGAANSVHFLLDQQADFTVADRQGRTALTLAFDRGHMNIAQMLKEKMCGQVRLQRGDVIEIEQPDQFHCATCQRSFADTTQGQHEASTLHLFMAKDTFPRTQRYHITESNVGFQMMLRQGWDRDRGLGPIDREPGKLFPVKTTLRNRRTGLGIRQSSPARVTHFVAFDRDAVKWREPPPRPKRRVDFERDARRNRRREIAIRRELS